MAGDLGNERDNHGHNANDLADELANFGSPRRRWRVTARLDELFRTVSLYAVPVAIMLVSGIVLLFQDSQYAVRGATPLAFQALGDLPATLGPPMVQSALERAPNVDQYSTHLSETPVWFRVTVPPVDDVQHTVIEFPSRHAQTLACWRNPDAPAIGRADRSDVSGAFRVSKAGFAIDLGQLSAPVTLLCEGTFSGPAHLALVAWPASELRISEKEFHRSNGLLEGGLLTLSAFVLVTAIINKEWLYVLFAAWLIGNLRLAANSLGADTQWLERAIPTEWDALVRKATFAIYYVLTYSLFTQLFKRELRRVGMKWLVMILQWAGVVLCCAAIALPYAHFIPVLWAVAALGIVIVLFLLVRILVATRSRVAIWYSASLAIVLFATFSEVIAAAFNARALSTALNSVTAALFSSLMAALAIAEQMRAEHQGKLEAQAELRNAYDVTPVGLFTLNDQGNFVRGNAALHTMLGIPGTEGRTYRWDQFFGQNTWRMLLDVAQHSDESELEILSLPRDDGRTSRYLVKAIFADGRIEGSLQDITERARTMEQLRYLAENDPLTGVSNRRGIEKSLGEAIRTLSDARPAALAYLDLDRFKLVNDLFGHAAGDEVLRQACDRMRSRLSADQSVGRTGGDEFIVVFRDATIKEAAAVARRLVDAIAGEPYQIGERAFQVRASAGVIELTTDMRVPDAISSADRACREAKKSRRELVVYERGAAAFRERLAELRLIDALDAGLTPNTLFLEMQPIMEMAAPGGSLNFEVLLRMRDGEGNIVPASRIISAAEENGTIGMIDKWVLTNTLTWIDSHRERLSKTQFVCVNLSGASLNDEHFIRDIFATLAAHERAVGLLCIEITETVALHDLDNTRRFVDRIHQMGGRIALDDFGAGFSSFSYLKDLAVDAIKIDGAFVKSMAAHPANLAIVEAIVALAKNLGIRSVAEWVEDAATLEALSELGVDYVQGFLIARPQTPEAILAAESAASFVRDPQLAALLVELGQAYYPSERGSTALH
ncbi:diguanylate cyclase [Pandoraea iniqua]|uniref:Diguanylate cyclase n=1 Tax=Pandoraea iniqua TaxID=2508288 RepID=A0A5E4XGV1_9BURK|nr:EAL domain-containing protein [Pandoraea iniqua]VVE35388.1 diguanylate cyclase [Pandoraea iniqua]VVE39240.1 diguanylate cyclase [Pandoraea iniqua]